MAGQGSSVATSSLSGRRAERVREAFAELPNRYLGAPADLDATFQIRLGDVGRTWEVRLRGSRCEVRPSPTREPDVVIGTDGATWLALREGRMSGLDAFSQRRLYAHGDLDLALGFEGLFRLPGGRDPLVRIAEVETPQGAHRRPDRRLRRRGRGLPPRPRGEQGLLLRDRRRPRARLHRACARPARVRLLEQARPRRLRRAMVRDRRARTTSMRWRSSGPMWSATRWAGGSRSSSPSTPPSGLPR